MTIDTSQMSGYARRWWGKVLFGIIAIIFGIVAFIYPRATVIIFLYLFGIFLLISGIVLISYALRGAGTHRWLNFAEGILSIIIAIILFISPRFSALTIAYIFAFFAIVYGVLQIVESLFLPRGDSSHGYTNRWFLFLAGIWSLLIGILIALFPAGGILAVIWLVAAFAIVVGILNILNGLQMRRQMVRGATTR